VGGIRAGLLTSKAFTVVTLVVAGKTMQMGLFERGQ
jgi:hypothetical protein